MTFGKMIEGKMTSLLVVIILVVVIVQVLAGSISYVTEGLSGLSSNLTAENVGFASFFDQGGLMYLILGAVVLILVITLLFKMLGGAGKR